MRSPTLFFAVCSASFATASAQLDLQLLASYGDTQATNGIVTGVTRDEVDGNVYFTDFDGPNHVHGFAFPWQLDGSFATGACSPSVQTPADVTWDPATDSLWILDAQQQALLRMSRDGTCLGGFSMSVPALPRGVTVHRGKGTLVVLLSQEAKEFDAAGVEVGTYPIAAPASASGITYVPATDRFLISSNAPGFAHDSLVHEMAPDGTLVSTTDLKPFGVQGASGLHYDVATDTLWIASQHNGRAYAFGMEACPQAQPFASGCAGSGGLVPSLSASGCSEPGALIVLHLEDGKGGAQAVLAAGAVEASPPLDLGGGCSLALAPPLLSLPLPFPLTGMGAAHLPVLLPANLPPLTIELQAFVADPASPIGFSVTNGLHVPVH